ncbi:PREDICTED: jacalin-related lectin 13-like [Camelina sativa]|uniref:Jacalin-related lectin 13-like n=1 Tax=Camelina sativa TaxID=90675 RepID=A0ABM0ZFZ5_CAMSA|nr:PREDICTED: jacalin-related lectin 13-like [Camelina sativa]
MFQDTKLFKMTQRLEAEGEKNPQTQYNWDDGSDHDGVTKIYVRGDREGIQFIKFGYVGTGQLIDESFHGFSNQGFTQMFEIDHFNGEYLVSVEGYHNRHVIQALQFKTNLKVHEIMGYENYDYNFKLALSGKKIIGFHGSAKSNLNCLGAYVTSITPTKMEAKGGKGGKEWNDGADYEALTKIHLRTTSKGIKSIQFDYVDKAGHPKVLVHGSSTAGGNTLEPVNKIKLYLNLVTKELIVW